MPTKEELNDEEKSWIEENMRAKNCYPIFITLKEFLPFMKFYENALKTLFHNFKSLYEDYALTENFDQWKDYL